MLCSMKTRGEAAALGEPKAEEIVQANLCSILILVCFVLF